ncbi:Outer membrane protein TolC [Thalassolituus maritimus]|uniref:Outer membrane protein TolC n=1 Tax=Thalassolituus maritimus TaxID=484498 RepID=A0A1N7Q9I0_9GAMM|nr:TolC family protein [Thalassolituus maritimus]SIT19522.1 Outer membrane protein TolC [Thalassolituus maritimus]
MPVNGLIFILCLFLISSRHDAHAQTLVETIDLALKHSSVLRQQHYQTDLAFIDKAINQAARDAEVELHLLGGAGQVATSKGAARFVQNGERYPLSAILELSYPIDIWGSDKRDDEIHTKTIQQKALDAEFTKHSTILDAVDVYVALARGNIERELQQERVTLLTKKVEEAEIQLSVGLYTPPFVEQIIAEKVEAESLLMDYELALGRDALLFQRLTGHRPVQTTNKIDIPFFPKSIDSIREKIDDAPQVKSLQYALQTAHLEVDNTDADYRSTLELIGNGGVQEGNIYLAERIYNYEFMLRWEIPLNNRALRSAAKSRSQVLAAIRQEGVKDARELIEYQIMQLIKQYETALAQADKLERILVVKSENLAATSHEAKVGKSTEFEVMERHYDWKETQSLLNLNHNTQALIAYQVRSLLGMTHDVE